MIIEPLRSPGAKLVMVRLLSMVVAILFIGCGGVDPAPQRAPSHQQDTLSTGTLSSYEQRQGKHLYTKYCAVCHGEEGKGDGFNAFNLDPKPRDLTDSKYMTALNDERLIETINEGGRGVNKSPLMPSWGGRLTEEEIRYIVSYLRTLFRSR